MSLHMVHDCLETTSDPDASMNPRNVIESNKQLQ